MKFYRTYFLLELKRAYKSFPKMLLSSILLFALIASLAFCGEQLIYGNANHQKAKIAFVTEDNSKLISITVMLLQSSESIASICDFIDTDSKSAAQMVADREAIASITIPEGFMDGLRHGTNVPIIISFSHDMTFIAGLLKELSYTATRILGSTQSGIFAQSNFYHAHNRKEELSDANYKLNEKYLGFIFSRNSIFKKVEVSTTGNVSVFHHYIAGGITLFFLLFSMSFVSFLMEDTKAFKTRLFCGYLHIWQYFMGKVLIVFSIFYVMYLLIALAAAVLLHTSLIAMWYMMIPALICLASLILLLYELAPNKLGGVIIIFLMSIVNALLSGCILPLSYLPHSLAAIGSILPTTKIIQVLSGSLGHSVAAPDVLYLAVFALLCFGATVLLEKKVRIAS